MTKAEINWFLEAIRSDNAAYYRMSAQINSSKSEAGKPTDRAFIHRAIHHSIGFTGLDCAIFSQLEQWMMHLSRLRIDLSTEDLKKSDI